MNLELKHITPYLPYEIKALCEISGMSDVVEVETYDVDHGIITLIDRYGNFLKNAKPILHPLSDLSKPCLEGDKVPMVELTKIAIKKFTTEDNQPDYEILHNSCLVKFNDSEVLFDYIEFMTFTMYNRTFHQHKPVMNQLNLFNFLFEHHFDVYNLISKNLAIDANTIKV